MNEVPTEEWEQVQLVNWLEAKGYKFSALPLSTYTKSWSVKRRNHLTGVRPGVPDMMIIANNKLIFVELKRRKRSTVSPAQTAWIVALKLAGVAALTCRGHTEAIDYIESVAHPNSSDMWPERAAA